MSTEYRARYCLPTKLDRWLLGGVAVLLAFTCARSAFDALLAWAIAFPAFLAVAYNVHDAQLRRASQAKQKLTVTNDAIVLNGTDVLRLRDCRNVNILYEDDRVLVLVESEPRTILERVSRTEHIFIFARNDGASNFADALCLPEGREFELMEWAIIPRLAVMLLGLTVIVGGAFFALNIGAVAALALTLSLLAWVQFSSTVRVGQDGVVVKRWRSREYFPFEGLKAAANADDRIELVSNASNAIRMRIVRPVRRTGVEFSAAKLVVDTIHANLGAYLIARSSAVSIATDETRLLLAQQPAPFHQGYRSHPYTASNLLAIVGSCVVTADIRLAAARALRSRFPEIDPARLKEAVAKSVNPIVRAEFSDTFREEHPENRLKKR